MISISGAAKVPREAAQQSDRARAREQGPRGTQGGNSMETFCTLGAFFWRFLAIL